MDEPARLEHLRDALLADSDLAQQEDITLFGARVDRARGKIHVRVAAPDAERAQAEIQRRHGDRVEVEVVAPSAYIDQDVPWECWTDDAGGRVTVMLMDYTDGSNLRASHRESAEEVVITVSGPRWQGAHHDIGYVVEKHIELRQPLAGRLIIDGATGEPRPNRKLVA